MRDGYAAMLIEGTTGHCEPAHLHYEDQDFRLAGTPWEISYCTPLKHKNAKPFIPLMVTAGALSHSHRPGTASGQEIRQGWTPAPTVAAEIVGYYGWTEGRNIWTHDGQADRNAGTGNYDLPHDWKPGDRLPVTAHYGRGPGQQRATGWAPFNEFSVFCIICSIRGEILGILERTSGTNGQAISGSVTLSIATTPIRRQFWKLLLFALKSAL